jgi:chemotaxis protein MotB
MKNRYLKSMQHPPRTHRDPAVWLTTFNDLITLLMVFFVLLFSMGSLDADRFAVFQKGLQNAMGVLEGGMNAPQGMVSDYQRSLLDRDLLEGQNFLKFSRSEGLEAEYTRKGIRITLRDELLFRSGSAKITEEGHRLLNTLAAVIRPMQRHVRIEGHTDDRPISTLRYPSNWELSTARAVNVLTYLLQGDLDPVLLSAAGYGSCRPRVPNDSQDNRALNRRVEIILGQTVSEPNAQTDWR